MSRLHDWYNHTQDNGDLSDPDLAAAIGSGDIDLPDYLVVSEDVDHLKIYDPEEGGSPAMGFIRIDYK